MSSSASSNSSKLISALAFLLIALMGFFLIKAALNEPTSDEHLYNIGQPASLNQFVITVTGFECQNSSEASHQFCQLAWTVENTGQDETMDAPCFSSADSGGGFWKDSFSLPFSDSVFRTFGSELINYRCLALLTFTISSGQTVTGTSDFLLPLHIRPAVANFYWDEQEIRSEPPSLQFRLGTP